MEEVWEIPEIWKSKDTIVYETEFDGMTIQVKDKKYVRHLCFGKKRTRQSAIWKSEPFKLQMQYARDIVKVVDKVKDPERILVLGLGGGNIPTYLYRTLPKTHIDVVDIVPELKDIAHKYFSMPDDPRLNVIVNDARDFLEDGMESPDDADQKYDLIFMDVFANSKIPRKLQTIKFYELLRNTLNDGGYAAFNTWVSRTSSGKYLERLKSVFSEVIEAHSPLSGNHIAFCHG